MSSKKHDAPVLNVRDNSEMSEILGSGPLLSQKCEQGMLMELSLDFPRINKLKLYFEENHWKQEKERKWC